MDDSDKLNSIVIGKYQNPRCMKNVDRSKLGCEYYAIHKAWMAGELFQRIIRSFITSFRSLRYFVVSLFMIDHFFKLSVSFLFISLRAVQSSLTFSSSICPSVSALSYCSLLFPVLFLCRHCSISAVMLHFAILLTFSSFIAFLFLFLFLTSSFPLWPTFVSLFSLFSLISSFSSQSLPSFPSCFCFLSVPFLYLFNSFLYASTSITFRFEVVLVGWS